MKKWLMSFLCVALLLVGCTSKQPPSGQGYIFEVQDGRVLVLEGIESEYIGETWDEISGDYTGRAIWLETGEKGLEAGQLIRYWLEGPVRESYPEQGTASKMEVIE